MQCLDHSNSYIEDTLYNDLLSLIGMKGTQRKWYTHGPLDILKR